jgi:hypothetical protein
MAETITTQLASIAAMVDRLAPLAPKTRGMPIQADEWNALIGVLADVLVLERTQETTEQTALESRFAPRVHKHIGEIGIESLDADLLARLGDGGVSLQTRLALADTQKQVGALGSEVARLSTGEDDRQAQLDQVRGDALDRENRLRGFGERFAAVENLRGLVSTLTAQVDGLSDAFKAVLELRASLRDEQGTAIDVAALVREVAGLDELGKALNGIDGKVVRMRDIELALRELRDALDLGDGGLDGRIDGAVGAAEERLNQKVDERAAAGDAHLEAGLGEARTALEARLEAVAAELAAQADAAVAAAEERISSATSARLEEALATLRRDLLAATAELVDARTSAARGEILEALDGRVGDAVKAALGDVDERIDRQLDERLSAFQQRLLETAREEISAVAARLEQELAATRDEAVRLAEESAKAMVSDLHDQLERDIALASRRQDTQLAQFREKIEARVRAIEVRLGIG